ncbi:MAG: PD-(D/E)XK nuclease family protein [Anaerolineae bacterium]
MILLLIAFLVALLAGWWLLRLGNQVRAASGLPSGEVVYSDTGAWQRQERPLISRQFGLVGKPDYLVAAGAAPVPVEVKSGRRPAQPYPGHILQLAAYCLLVEETWHVAPAFGLLHYAGRPGAGQGASGDPVTLRIPYTPALKAQLLEILSAMRADRQSVNVARSHEEAVRCQHCGLAHACDEKLT